MKLDSWSRLVDVARQAPDKPEAQMPFGFDTRVIARWKSAIGDGEGVSWMPFLRGALVCSTVIMLFSLAVNYRTTRESESAAVAIADSALRISLSP